MANFNFNKVIIGGRLCADPELKTTTTGISTTSFNIAVNRKAKSGEEAKADFISCVAWRNNAEFITRYFHKGSSICIIGSLQTRNWTDNSGNKRYVTEVLVDEVTFVDSKGSDNSASYAAPPQMEEITDDEELPF